MCRWKIPILKPHPKCISHSYALCLDVILLAKRFGNPFVTASAFRKKLDEWKPVCPNDAVGLRKFSDFLVQCETAMDKVSCLNVLNDIQENQKMISKLPKWLSTRWVKVVYESREKRQRFPEFSEFVKFIERESNIACDPINVRIGKNLDDHKQLRDPRRQNPSYQRYKTGNDKERRNFVTKTKEGNDQIDDEGAQRRATDVLCQLCKNQHEIDTCQQFRKMDIKERKAFAASKGLCFSCLEHGHLSKQCRKRKKCDICGRSHPTSLHGDVKVNVNDGMDNKPPPNENVNSTTVNCMKASFMTDGGQIRISSMIVPMWVDHIDDPNNEILIYALLDDQSDTTFISHGTLNRLNVSGPETVLSLSTMHADSEAITSSKIKGLVICDHGHNVSIPLPKHIFHFVDTSKTLPDSMPRNGKGVAASRPHRERSGTVSK